MEETPHGVGVLIDNSIKTKMIEVIKKRNQTKRVKLIQEASVISVYILKVGCAEDVKNTFWKDIYEVMHKIPTRKRENYNWK